MSRLYRTYGLTLRSDVDLPELTPAPEGVLADVRIVRRSVDGIGPGNATRFEGEAAVLQWEAVGRFRVTRDTVVVECRDDVPDDLVAFPLLGAVLATLLHLRETFVLHASAVAVEGRAVVLLGHKGAGKSTTAAALVAAGHALLTDDIVAIDACNGTPVVRRGFAQMKLSDPALRLVADRGRARPQAHAEIDKTRLVLDAAAPGPPQAVSQTVPLGEIYMLERGGGTDAAPHAAPLGTAALGIAALDPGAALAALVQFSYMTRFGDAALSGPARMRHLRDCAALAGAGAVHRLTVPHGVERLREALSALGNGRSARVDDAA